ncbi:syntaxin-5 [Nematostella vectensis]|uniref:syntaxin-5 n=1 Tax=Nematostella vectensis TaxID=45351 RepID=UPI00139031EE|nr:syntaxin-5 [Nematostella vectensis]
MTTRRRRTRSNSEDHESNSRTISHPTSSSLDSRPTDMTSCRDRTTEFYSAVKSIQSRQVKASGIATSHPGSLNGVHPHKSQFFVIAKHIGHDISNTFAKLEKLAILAKKKSLFDDRPMEIQELTHIIKQDINSLNQQIAQLQELVKSKSHSEGRHQQTHSNTVVLTLQSKLATMSKDFKSVLEVRTQNLKQQKERRDKFSQGGFDMASASVMPGTSVLQRANTSNDNMLMGGSDHIAIDMGGADNHLSHMNNMSQAQLLDEQDTYIQSRASAMESIESTIVELGSIFTQLAHMVKEQEEQIQRIDANVESTEMNVEAAHGEILKYFQSISSNRWLIIKIFMVLIVFFVIFVVFMA